VNEKRFLIKLSGEVLKGSRDSGISFEVLDNTCKTLSEIIRTTKVQIGFVVGGGNIFRGGRGQVEGYDRLYGDQIGMMATIINGLSLVERLRFYGIPVVFQSGIKVDGVVDLFNRDLVEENFSRGGAAVFSGGIGNPYFSTDTTAVLRGLQIGAEKVFKATKVSGIYDRDPEKFQDAVRLDQVTFSEMIEKNIEVMDLTAIIMMQKNRLPLMVFNMTEPEALMKACRGEIVGTLVKE
jgi:uridylate kinase